MFPQPVQVDTGPAALSGRIPSVYTTILPSEQVPQYLYILFQQIYDFLDGRPRSINVSATCAGRYWTRGPIRPHSECIYHYTTIGTNALLSLYFISPYIPLFRQKTQEHKCFRNLCGQILDPQPCPATFRVYIPLYYHRNKCPSISIFYFNIYTTFQVEDLGV